MIEDVSVRSGAIRSEYVRRGWQAGPLGWPVAEAEALPGGGSQQRFQNGTIVTSSKGTFEMDGEMQVDAAVVTEEREARYPFSTLSGDANVLVFPSLDAANIAYKLLWRLGGAEVIGPILLGMNKAVNVL